MRRRVFYRENTMNNQDFQEIAGGISESLMKDWLLLDVAARNDERFAKARQMVLDAAGELNWHIAAAQMEDVPDAAG